jgi:hypothetical protein
LYDGIAAYDIAWNGITRLCIGSRSREDAVTDRLDRWANPPLLVLASLAGGPKHGYAITRDVAQTMGARLSAGTGHVPRSGGRCG